VFGAILRNAMSDERRTTERVLFPLEARWEGQSGRHTSRISDISLGGCYIESLGQVTVGETIGFELQLPTGRWMRLRGTVAYQHPNVGFGVQFMDLSELENNLLSDVIEFGR
jgi:hypothetical protein